MATDTAPAKAGKNWFIWAAEWLFIIFWGLWFIVEAVRAIDKLLTGCGGGPCFTDPSSMGRIAAWHFKDYFYRPFYSVMADQQLFTLLILLLIAYAYFKFKK